MQEHELTLVRWLEAHTPDDWHQVAIDWNWDAGLDVLGWIAAQPECDRATAQHIILVGGAAYYLRFPDREALVAQAPYNVEPFDLLAPAIARWNAGFYTRSEIATYRPNDLGKLERDYRAAEAEQAARPLPWQLDASVFQPIHGRIFSYRYAEGWPPQVETDLRSRGISY